MTRQVLFVSLLFVTLVAAAADSARVSAQALQAFDGRPEFKEGSDLSYFVWRDGSTWHVRWTTLGQQRVFTGMVRALSGRLEDLKRIDVDTEWKVIRPGRPARVVRGPAGRVRGVAPGRAPIVASKTEDHITRIDDRLIRWNTEAAGDIDGFTFKVDDVAALSFELNIQGQSRPQSVEIGRNNVHPAGNPFTVKIR